MVEWKTIGEFATLQKTKNKKHLTENAYSITQAGLVPTKSFFKEKTNITSSDTSGYYIVEKDWFVYSPSRIDVGSINYLRDEGPVIVSPIDVVFSVDTKVCLPAYLLEYFFTYKGKNDMLKKREGVEGMGRRNLPFEAIKGISIPIPSLSEQQRIVGILDMFTASIDNLKAQIDQRRKQYEYYRDQLLDLEGKAGVEMKALGDVIRVKKGEYITKKDEKEGVYPVILGGKEPAYYIDRYNHEGKAIVISRSGASAGYVSFWDEPIFVTDGFLIEPKEGISFEFLYYVLKNKQEDLHGTKRGGAIPHITPSLIGSFKVYVPQEGSQRRIVSILDTFELSLRNLECQLKGREAQYEYYRNKLLTFE